MFRYVRKAFRRFTWETDALVTIQVVLFSVMLFGAIGFIIDFGRAYSAHSQMQAYIDEVALAAASELDQKPAGGGTDNAITRATLAANSVSKTSIFTEGGGDFQIAQLIYLTGSPTDANGNFDYALVTGGTLTTTNAALATHVLAIAQPASVRASLLDINVSGMGSSINDIPIGAFAVATRRQVTCSDVSTLVMCNPFEGDPTRSLESVFENGGGYRVKLTASTTLGLNTNSTQIGVGVIKNPVSLMGTDSGACEDVANLPGYSGQSGAALEALRDKCLLAVVDTGLSCINDELIVKDPVPGDILTGLDVLFDMYDDEMASILTTDVDLGGGLMRSTLFYPDIAAVHGNLHRSEIPDYYQAQIDAINADPSIPFFLKPAYISQATAERDALLAAYAGDATQPASRLNHIPVAPGSHGPMENPVCFATDCTAFGTHGAIYTLDIQPTDYATGYYTPNVTALTAANLGVPESSVSSLDGSLLVGSTTSFYEFYSQVERVNTDLWTFPESNGADYAGIENNFVRTWPENYTAAYPSFDMTNTSERRRVRVSVVNCGSKTSYDAGDGLTSYKAEVVDVVDLFLTRAPEVDACLSTFNSSTDPQGINPCGNEDTTDVSIYAEYIGSVTDELQSSGSRTYAVLVH